MKRIAFAAASALTLVGVACSRDSRIGSFRDALASGDGARVASAVEGAPACAGPAGSRSPGDCLGQMATWFGSKTGFHFDEPDQASAAVAALAIARDTRGESIPAPDAWLFVARTGAGPGADALRLAITTSIAAQAPAFARTLDADADARALMRAVGESVPGACETYALLGAGADDDGLPAAARADHSPCVQKDLDRTTGPREHGRYGSGVWRGAEGALALWKEAGAAVHAGASKGDAATQSTMAPKLATIDAALTNIALKKLSPAPDLTQFMGGVHAGAPVVAPSAAPRAFARPAASP